MLSRDCRLLKLVPLLPWEEGGRRMLCAKRDSGGSGKRRSGRRGGRRERGGIGRDEGMGGEVG